MRQNWRCYLAMVALVVILVFGQEVKAQSTPMNLKQALEMALSNNYTLKSDSLEITAADYKTKVAKADFLPQAKFTTKGEYNLALPKQMLPGSVIGQPSKDLVPVQFGTRYYLGGGIEVNQNIWRKDLRLQVKGAELNTDIARTRYSLSKEELVYEVANAFYSLQTNAELIRITSRDHRNMQEITKIAKMQFENGILKRIDYESLQINTANKESQLSQLQSDYDKSLSYFKYLLGVPVNAEISISDSIATISESGSFTDAQLMNREDIHLSRQLIESKEIELKSIRAEYLPSISSYFRFNYQSQFNELGNAFKNDYRYKSSTVGITASIPIFDGYRRKNRISVAQLQLEQLRFQSQQKQDLAKTELVSSSATLISYKKQYSITQQNLALAENVFNSRISLYAEGVTSLIELLDAERELSQAKNLHIQAMTNVQTSLVEMHKAKGTLLTEFLKTF
jgi:outer membrane protein